MQVLELIDDMAGLRALCGILGWKWDQSAVSITAGPLFIFTVRIGNQAPLTEERVFMRLRDAIARELSARALP